MAEGGGFFLPEQVPRKRRGTAGIRDADWTPGVHASLKRWWQAILMGVESETVSVDTINPPPPPPSMKGKGPAVPQDDDNTNKKRKWISVKNSRPRVMGEQIASSSGTKKKPPLPPPPPRPPSPLTQWVLDRFRGMGAPDHLLTRVLSKRLTLSDIAKGQNRLQLSPKSVLQSGLLQVLEEGVEDQLDGKEGIEVVGVDGHEREYRLIFKHIPSNDSYRIMGSDYRLFVEANDLQDGEDTVHLCLFYVQAADGLGRHLRLGIVNVRQ